MLVLNLWEGDDKMSLLGGSGKYGHAAMWLPGVRGFKGCYISWWPGGGRTEYGKKRKTKSVEHSHGRSVHKDMWAEHGNRYRSELLFNLDKEVAKVLHGASQDDFGMKSALARARIEFKLQGEELSSSDKHLKLGVLSRGSQWLIDDIAKQKLYICHLGSTHLKVLHLTGHRHFFEFDVDKALCGEQGEVVNGEETDRSWKDWIKPAMLAKNKKLPLDREYYIDVLSKSQKLFVENSNGRHTFYLSFVPKEDKSGCTVRVGRWTRSFLAPDVNIEIPIVSQEGHGLDDEAIRRWWLMLDETDAKWSTLERNCSTTAATALFVGGAKDYVKPHTTASWLCWTPTDVKTYGEALNAAIKANPQKPKRLSGDRGSFELGDLTKKKGFDPDKDTVVWTKAEFKAKTNVSFSFRPKNIKAIDTLLDDYHNRWGSIEKLISLNKIMQAIAEVFYSDPKTKRMEGLLELGERCIVQQAVVRMSWRFEDHKMDWGDFEPDMLGLVNPYLVGLPSPPPDPSSVPAPSDSSGTGSGTGSTGPSTGSSSNPFF